jgi:WD40 repeat protein
LSEDGKTCLCLAGVLPSTVQVFDAVTGKPLRSLGDVRAAGPTADGKTVVASRKGEILVWDATTGKLRQRFQGNDDEIAILAVSPDGSAVALAGFDEQFRLFDLSQNKATRLLPGLRGPVHALAFSGDGKILAAAGWGGVIRLWDWRAGKELFDVGHRDAVVSLAFSPDSKTLLSRGLDYTVRVWELAAGKQTGQFPSHAGGHQRQEHFVLFQVHDSKSLFRSVADGVGILNWKTGKERPLELAPKGIPAAIAPDGKSMVTYQLQGTWTERTAALTYTLWDLVRGEKIREFTHSFKNPPPLANAGVRPQAVAIAPDGKTIATSWIYLRHGPMYTKRVGHGVSLWDVASGQERPLGSAAPIHLTFLDGGKTLVCADANSVMIGDERDENVMEFWDVATGKKLRAVVGPDSWCSVVAFSPDGKLFATASGHHDGVISLWRTATGQRIQQFVGHRQGVECLAFSPDGRMLASGSMDTTILLWEILRC